MEDNKEKMTEEEIVTEEVLQSGEEMEAETPQGDLSDKKEEKSFFSKKKAGGDVKKLKEELTAAQNQAEEAQNRYVRLAAEYDNYKKRTARELDARYADAKCDVLKSILPVIDNFERGLAMETEDTAYKEGVVLIFKQFLDLLSQHGVTEIEAQGKVFDPELHNAVMHVEDENAGENEIVEVFMKGYQQGDKVLRHSMVKVAN